jgi:hypothetical protein
MSQFNPFLVRQNLSPSESIQEDIEMFGRGVRRPTEQEGIDFNKKIKERISGLSESDRNSFYDKNPSYNPEFRVSNPYGQGGALEVADPRGTGGALEGSPRGPQQQNPYDSLKKLFGVNLRRSGGGFGGGLQDMFRQDQQFEGRLRPPPMPSRPDIYESNQGPQLGGNLQRSGGNLQDLFGRIGQQTGQMQGSPTNSQYEGRNPDGSSFRSQFPMGNNPPRPRVMTQGPESMLEQPLREEVGDTFNRRIQGQMGQSQGRMQPGQGWNSSARGLSKEFLSGIFGAQRPMPSQMPYKI